MAEESQIRKEFIDYDARRKPRTKRFCVRFDILPSLDLWSPLKRKRRGFLRERLTQPFRWVPASRSGLTALTLHRLTSGIPALKH